MIDRQTLDGALSILRAEMQAAPPAEREETINNLLAMVAVMAMDHAGVDGAVARLRREADELEADYETPPAREVN